MPAGRGPQLYALLRLSVQLSAHALGVARTCTARRRGRDAAEIQPRFRSFSFLDDLGRERRAGGGPRPKGQSGRTLELRLARGRRLVTRGVRGRAGVNNDIAAIKNTKDTLPSNMLDLEVEHLRDLYVL